MQVFAKHPVAADMLLDILSDRGFSGAYIVNERIIPARIDPDTWEVKNEIDLIHKFRCSGLAPTPDSWSQLARKLAHQLRQGEQPYLTSMSYA